MGYRCLDFRHQLLGRRLSSMGIGNDFLPGSFIKQLRCARGDLRPRSAGDHNGAANSEGTWCQCEADSRSYPWGVRQSLRAIYFEGIIKRTVDLWTVAVLNINGLSKVGLFWSGHERSSALVSSFSKEIGSYQNWKNHHWLGHALSLACLVFGSALSWASSWGFLRSLLTTKAVMVR